MSTGIRPGWFILVLLTVLSGSITVKIPSVPATISVSETFVFTAVLLFGPSAGTVTVALDGLVISLWLQRRRHQGFRATFNMAAPSISIWVSAQLFFLLSATEPLVLAPATPIPQLLLPLVAFTALYFLLNSWLVAFAIAFEKKVAPTKVWRDNFLWLGLNFFGGASVAALLVAYTHEISWTAVGIIVPLLVISYLTNKTAMGRVEDATHHLAQLNVLYLSTVETLAKAIDARDQVTHGHIRRVQSYAAELAREVGVRDQSLMKAIEAAALLHDLGKLRVPEYILNKPGRLTSAEFEKIKSHSMAGAEILSSIDFQYPVVPIVRHHHENWDGTGYPDGLAGTEIPIGARILAIVDCFDALTSDRPYRQGLTEQEATRIVLERRGSMYDPVLVDCFLRVHGRLATEEGRQDLQVPALAGGDSSAARSVVPASAIEAAGVGCLDVTRGQGGFPNLLGVGDAFASDLIRTTPASLCVVYLYREATDDLLAAYSYGINAQAVAGLRMQLAQGVSGWVAANRQTVANSDPSLDLRHVSRPGDPLLRSCLSTPLLADNRLVGVLTVYSTGLQAFSEEHRRNVESSGRQLARVIETLASVPLAGGSGSVTLPLSSGPVSCSVTNGPASSGQGALPHAAAVMLIEFSHLLAVDGGDAEPDAEYIASLLHGTIRSGDILLRYGPNQLLLILPQTDVATAQAIAGRISSKLGSTHRGTADRHTPSFHAQIGLALVPQDGLGLDLLVLCARRRLEPSEPAASDRADGLTH